MGDKYTDRSEHFVSSPAKVLLHSDKTASQTNSSEAEGRESQVSENVSSGDSPSSPVKVASATWQVKKTTAITSSTHITEVTHQPRSVSTAQIHIKDSNHSVDRTENKHTVVTETKHVEDGVQKKDDSKVVQSTPTVKNDSPFVNRDESVMEKNGSVSTSTSENSFEDISISEAKDTALDVSGTPISDENKVYSRSITSEQSVFSSPFEVVDSTQVIPVCDDAARKKDNDETSIQRITYTPGLSIRDFTLEEIKDKKQKSPEMKQMVRSEAEAEVSFDIGRSLSSLQASSMSWTTNQTDDDLLSEQDLVQPLMVGELVHMSVCKVDDDAERFPLPLSPEGELYIPDVCSGLVDSVLEVTENDVLDMLDEAAGTSVENKVNSTTESYMVKTEDIAFSNFEDIVEKKLAVQEQTDSPNRSDSLITSMTTEEEVKDRSQTEMKTEVKSLTEQRSQTEMKTEVKSLTEQRSQTEMKTEVKSLTEQRSQTEMKTEVKSLTEQRSQTEMKTEVKSLTEQSVSLQLHHSLVPENQDDANQTINLREVSQHKEASKSEVTSSQMEVSVKSEPIEIERKFNITADTEQKLIALGASLVTTKSFTDVYYDNLDYTLTLANCWLRQRQGEWQLKDSVAGSMAHSRDITTQYAELTKESDIINTLLQKLQLHMSKSPSSVVDIIKAGALTEFATIMTTRKTYKLPNCSIDLDLTDSGFMVGEIEVMTTTDKIPSALKTIEETAHKLGMYT